MEREFIMKKNPFNMLKLGVVGCAMLVGASAAIVPMTGIVSAEAMKISEKGSVISPTGSPISTVSNSGISVKEEILKSVNANLKTNIKVPQLTGMLDTKYQEELNDIMLSHAGKDLAKWESDASKAAAKAKKEGVEYRPYELTIDYSLKENKTSHPSGIVSLIITTEGATGGTSMPRVDTYNVFNTKQAERITLSDLFGDNFKKKLDAGILAKINKNPGNYFKEDFKGVNEEQDFYVEQGEVVILFPKYSIAPGSMGTPEFHFSIAKNGTVKPKPVVSTPAGTLKLDLQKVDKYKNAKGITMVSLRDVAKSLGYEIKWNQVTHSAELKKGAQWTSVSLGKDSYFLAKKAPVALGAAPIMKKGAIYVPVKFVSNILGMEVK
jgi:hypothetical protein